MNIEELKEHCLEQIKHETQLEQAEKLADNFSMQVYHKGRKEVWLSVHKELVRMKSNG